MQVRVLMRRPAGRPGDKQAGHIRARDPAALEAICDLRGT